MIELEPQVGPPAPQPRRPCRRLVVAGVTLLAMVAGGFVLAAGGDGPESKPLALMATDGRGDAAGAEQMTAAAPANGGFAPADSSLRSSIPYYGGWGITFKVAGDLPELAERAAAWKATGPALDGAAVARIADALGLAGTPVQRDGGWWVDAGDWTLNAFPGELWSVNLSRGRFDGRPDDAANGAGGDIGPALSRSEAEQRVRDLIGRMGAPAGTWKVEITETEMGTGWACATPARGFTDEELKRLEAEKLRHVEQQNPAPGTASGSGTAVGPRSTPAAPVPDAAIGSGPADQPASDAAVMSCPPPPAPVKGFNVALFPVLDGRRADWPVWNVTMRSDGRVDNLYGSWVTFERAGDHKLRGVSAALKELQNPPVPEPAVTGGAVTDPAMPDIAVDGGPAVDVPGQTGAGSTGSAGSAPAPSRVPLDGAAVTPGTATPGIEPAPPVCPPAAMPMPMPPMPADGAPELDQPHARGDSSSYSSCISPEPQVVTITGVELGLLQAPVWEDGKSRLHLVPAYRFTGHFQDGFAWETSVVALHRDAIAPPPDFPVRDLGGAGDIPGIGKAEPTTAVRPG